MINARKVRHGVVALVAAVAAITFIPAANASATNDFGQLTARWWQWAYAHEAIDVGNTNTFPILDSTGEFAGVGQEHGIGPADKYFFLTGTFGQVVTRTVTVPAGKTLFFPLINYEVDNAVDPPTDNTVPTLKEIAKVAIDGSTALSATFDGQAVPYFRSVSPTFDYTLPDQNTIYDYFGLFGPQFEGRINPAVSDGYWAYVPPPSSGAHTLHFHSEMIGGFLLDVTYHLTVA